jgi:O-antigen/teichoic acid export membrane protein
MLQNKTNNSLKSLAGETAIYGLSTILARFINFVFVPIYTYTLSEFSYGVATVFLAYIAILQVLFTFGLETGCFRFANKESDSNKVFSNAIITISSFSIPILLAALLFYKEIANLLDYSSTPQIIIYLFAILCFDSISAILFARLRFQKRALKFATFKTIKILSETALNLVLFFVIPKHLLNNPDSFFLNFISSTPDHTYILFAIFISSLIGLILFIPQIVKLKLSFSPLLWKEMMLYSIPIMLAGLPGILNDFIDRILFKFFSPIDNIWQADLGVFQAGVKVATIMMLFIQMFRFAAEPFFFAQEKERDFKKTYAKVMTHFTAFSVVIFLGVLFYLDIIQYLLGKDFRSGLSIVPIMLLSYIVLGINFNLSMWYKLSGKTKYGIIITSVGLPVTIAINIIFMPIFSYHAAAWGHLLSYTTMVIISIYLGKKHYPIDYNWKRVIFYILLGIFFYLTIEIIEIDNIFVKYLFRTSLIVIYIIIYSLKEKINLWKLK